MIERPIKLLILLLLLAVGAPALAEEPLPPWLVPVVQLLDGGQVLPTTGVSLGQGRVLVASEFAAPGAQLVVLDGGVELSRFGRDATVASRHRLEGLAILSVPGLERPAPLVAPAPLPDDQLLLLAYPPAAGIAAGATAVRQRTRLRAGSSGLALDDGWPLPNLTGALVDACGHWVGASIARGEAAMASHRNTRYLWTAALLPQLGITDLTRERCERAWPDDAPQATKPVAAAEDSVAETAEASDAPLEALAGEPLEQEPSEPPDTAALEPASEGAPDPMPDPAEELPSDDKETLTVPAAEEQRPGPEQGGQADDSASDGQLSARLTGILALGLLLALAAVIVFLRRRRRDAGAAPNPQVLPVTVAARLEAPDQSVEHPVLARGGQVDATLGRFDCDILLDAPAISRRHARIFGDREGVFIEDLGSSYGSTLNGRALVPGEPQTLAFGDELRFADSAWRFLAAGEAEQ